MEVNETHPTTSPPKHIVDEMITAIDAAADFEDSLQSDLGLTTHAQNRETDVGRCEDDRFVAECTCAYQFVRVHYQRTTPPAERYPYPISRVSEIKRFGRGALTLYWSGTRTGGRAGTQGAS